MALIDVNGKRFKNFMTKLYGLGAAVVIMGALFKILHLPFADLMLIIGLTTEAVIFAISAFEAPVKEYDWSLVYPEFEGGESSGKGGSQRHFDPRDGPHDGGSQDWPRIVDQPW